VINPDLDYDNYININNISARKKLLLIIEERNLFDTYRQFNSNTKRFTWRKKNPLKQSRLYFFSHYAVKSTWIRRLFICNSKCTKIFEKEINTHLLFNYGIDFIQICVNKLKNSFWKDVLIAFITIQEKNKQNSFAYFLKMPLFHNKLVKNRKFFNFL